MVKSQIIIHQSYVEELIKSLHESGLIEIINISKEEPSLIENIEPAESHQETSTLVNYELRLTRLIDILKKTKKSPGGIKGFLNPQLPEIKEIEDRNIDELYSYAEGFLNGFEKNILSYEEKVAQLDEEKEKINCEILQLEYLKDFDIDLSYLGESKYVTVIAGKTSDLEDFKKKIETFENVEIYSKKFVHEKFIEWVVIIVAHISEIEKINKFIREDISIFNFANLKGSPKEILENYKKKISEIYKQKNQIQKNLQNYREKTYNDLLALREEILLERVRREVSKNFAKTSATFIIKGWVLEKNENKLKEIIEKASNGYATYQSEKPKANPDNPPIYIETPKWASTFRTFLELFATPKYNELNPTVFMGIFFIIFFALMLGDAGYGLTILILSLFGYFKIGKFSRMLKEWSFLGMWLGFTTVIVGFLTNGFFGDFLPRFFGSAIPSFSLLGINFPLEPLRDPLAILSIALVFGIIHLNLGIILGMIQAVHNKNYKKFLLKHFNWIPMQIGGGLLIGNYILGWTLNEYMFYVAIALTLIGLILLFYNAGPIGFFEITGYVGDWLSYARLLALGLATTGMALAFNIVSQLMGDMVPFIGIVVTIILLLILHTVNLVLQSLGAAVHSLRLQYVEFFNRYYEGGGKGFSPFKINRRYTKLEEK